MTQPTENVGSITLTANNAKKFANRLKKTLQEENINFKTAKCYDILAKTFGTSNWHELSQHLTPISNNDSAPIINHGLTPTSTNNLSNSLLNASNCHSIFDLAWVEFIFMTNQICEDLKIDPLARDTIKYILEIVRDRNKSHSAILWDKLDTIFSDSFDFNKWIMRGPSEKYLTLETNVPLELQGKINKHLKLVFQTHNFNSYEIVKFFEFLSFLKTENFWLSKKNYVLEINEAIEYDSSRGEFNYNHNSSPYDFLSNLLHCKNEIRKCSREDFSFHELIIAFYIKGPSFIRQDYSKNLRLNLIETLFKDINFSAYLLNFMHYSFTNEIMLSQRDNDLHYITCKMNFFPETPQKLMDDLFNFIATLEGNPDSRKFIVTVYLNENSHYINKDPDFYTEKLQEAFSKSVVFGGDFVGVIFDRWQYVVEG